ncbi:hypothetical protein MYCTH_2130377 [Thermothelomyces thermophilus ATCC 42464]|uniref:Uncharacterized protein n=1 Tax=Thermothelomyces thermophilus (strain ATCC 42464 / BCRC 31852 / DSM 1799) TaxID=573729 RepID=G2QMP4_THET4|nr:uncharacterized protein MYCTH_2130377 [Thermothelomyces thermophilus ATCC 42464]AEO61224.1 hypothetical protein MYCTH_2130377 [Thermothelomyces thermophilus ATCC 42464]
MTKQDLDDRKKSDGLASLIVRSAQHLTVTTIELTTVSFVVILFGTAWCWKDKPSDVQTTIPIKSTIHIDEIVASVSPFTRRVCTKPWDRVPGDMFLLMDFDLQIALAWRAASLYMIIFGISGCLWMGMWVWVNFPRIRHAEGPELSLFARSLEVKFLDLHRAPYRDPSLPRFGQASAKRPTWTRNLLDVLDGRVYPDRVSCWVESLPSDAYLTVEWLSFLPHG